MKSAKPSSHGQHWDEQWVEHIKLLLLWGYSAGAVAKMIGCTRNQVIGLSYRRRMARQEGPPMITVHNLDQHENARAG